MDNEDFLFTREKFESFVLEAVEALPSEIQERIKNIPIILEDWPLPEESHRYEKMLLGIYRVFWAYPRMEIIKIYQGTLERAMMFETKCPFGSEVEMAETVRKTVWHEVGHFLGMKHEQMKDLGLL